MDILSFGHGLPTGTIQAQIVFQHRQECLRSVGEDVRGYRFTAEMTVAKITGNLGFLRTTGNRPQ
jgi:hypothetical protein